MTTWTFDLPTAPVVDLRAASGRIELVAGPDGHATVELDAEGRRGAALVEDSRVEVVGERLVVHVPAHGSLRRSPLGLPLGAAMRLRLVVPEGTALEATLASARLEALVTLRAAAVKSASGDVRLEHVAGPAQVRLASGDVHFGHIAGDLSAATASGEIRGGDVGGDFSGRTVSGSLEVGRLAGDVRARTVSGRVSIGELQRGDADVGSTSGRAQIRVAPGLELDLDVATVSGVIHSELDPVGVPDEDGDAGRNTPVDLRLRTRTVSGDVAILRSHGAGVAATS
jgi:hypothetical protein